MNLAEAEQLFLNKMVDISWETPNQRKGAIIPQDTKNCLVVKVYENCYGEILAKFENKIFVPVSINKLKLSTNSN